MRKTLKRDLIAVIWTLLVTYAIGKLRDMEKEHSIRNQSAPTDNHIVAVPAL